MKTEFEVNKKDKIENLIHFLLEHRLHGTTDPELDSVLYHRRKEVARYLNQYFRVDAYNLLQRNHLYALLFGLFVLKLDTVKPIITKLIISESDENTKKVLSGMLTYEPARQRSATAQGDSQRLAGYKKLADGGHDAAQFVLGSMYEFGRGVTKDSAAAIEWYKKAAAQGHSKAQAALKRLDK